MDFFVVNKDLRDRVSRWRQEAEANPTKISHSTARHADPVKHPERFCTTYILEAKSEEEARKLARELCLEQTVELPGETDVVHEVESYVVGSIERIEEIQPNHTYRVAVAYPNDTAGDELTQWLNVVFGNTSLKRGVSVENVALSHRLEENKKMFPGPRFGISGLRRLLGIPQAPLLMTALKPMGKSSREFARMAYQLAHGGIDIIKDDHGLANQCWAPFEERVSLCAQAVQRSNQETGRHCLYAPCLNAPATKIVERAYYAKEAGAGAVMLLPGISGFDIVRELAADANFGLPILIHPALLGGWLQDHNEDGDSSSQQHPHGLSHEFLFGVLPRLCGGDAVIFPNAGGRFQFTKEECQAVVEGCRRPMGRFEPILPSPAGGMKLHRVEEMRQTFGDDTLYLIGGALLEQGPDLEEDAKAFVHCAGRDRPYSPPHMRVADCSKPTSMTDTETGSDTSGCSIAEVERVAHAVRRRVLEYTIRNNGGYLSQACSSAETLATLYLRALNLGPSVSPAVPGAFRGSPGPHTKTITGEGHNGDFTDPSLDRLIFGPVHYALVLYSLLVEVGRLDIAAFRSYNIDGSTVELIGAEHSPGHAVTAGSLAQALSQGAGIAYARKLKGHTGRVVVYMSDGEMQEGQTWEAVQALAFHKIGNLTAVVDVNGQQCDGKMDSVMDIGNLAMKLKAFGAHVHEVDGHNIQDIERACKSNSEISPTFVLCRTDPCRGFPLLRERAPKLHYVRFKDASEKSQWEDILANMGHTDTSDNAVDAVYEPPKETPRVVKIFMKPDPDASAFYNQSTSTQLIETVETVTRPHRTHLVEWAKRSPCVIILTADLTSSCEADLLRDTLPGQYLSLGMAEQNMMSFAGGLTREGYRPYIHTFGVFLTRRPFDQVAMSIGVPNLPVRLLGFLPGLTTPGGVTHQAIDDIALMRSIPNMHVLECGDATEVESVLDVAEEINGPVYIRMLRGEVPRLFPKTDPMRFGVVRVLSEGTDVALVTSGICTEEALRLSSSLKSAGVGIKHLHLSTIVPFPSDVVLKVARSVKHGIITMENHSIIGGVGSATAEALAEAGISKRLIRLGVPGVYAHGASCPYLLNEYGLDGEALKHAIETLLGTKLITDEAPAFRGEAAGRKAPINHGLSVEERPEDL